ncbi:MAG: precorrin-2 C(20)-methyltransferase [Parabacteroides sp.]|nr:precorrin-2 C(20)-methyltransferase [Parabacteroides sp.]
MSKTVSFVSLGPGYVDNITMKALRRLSDADIIFCPATKNKDGNVISRTNDLICELGLKKCIRLFVVPMERDRTKALEIYRAIADEINEFSLQEKRIVVAVEGDAGIYASTHYIMDFLKEMNITVSQISGVPSFIAAGACAQLQMVEQDERLVVVPGNVTAEELDSYFATNHTVVIMKLSKCQDVVKEYIVNHPELNYHYIENASLPEREYYTTDKEELISKVFPYFSLMIIKH